MIPISVTIKGLYSYQEEQVIEFDKLLEGQLFGIFGSVGSGKSSILEAIAFALYGETERMNRSDNRSYNMMNLKSNELWIDFKFKNYDESVYRFTVRGKRHGKDFTKVGSLERKAYKLNDANWEPLELRSAEEVLGLSYVNFRRTIIIPQGKFQEFLQLGDKARTDMLKEIFDLSKYEFFHQTASLERKNKDAIQNLQGQLSHYELIEKAYLDEKETRLKQLKESLAKQQEQLNKKREEFQTLSTLKRQVDQKEEFQKELDKLLLTEGEILIAEKKVQEYEYCLLHFKDKLNRKEEVESTLKQQTEQLGNTQQQVQENTEVLTFVNRELETVQFEYLRQDDYKEQVADYGILIQLNRLKTELAQLQQRIESGQVHVKRTELTRDERKKEFESAKEEKKQRQSLLPDMIELAELRTWYDQRNRLEQYVSDVKNRLDIEQAEVDTLLRKIGDQLLDPLLLNVEKGEAPGFHLDAIHALKSKIQNEQDLVRSRIDQFRLKTKLGEFTNLLRNGEACVLCGSTDHPQIMEIEDVELHLKDEETKLNDLKQDEAKLGKYIADLSHYTQTLRRLTTNIQSLQGDHQREASSLQKHLEQFKWDSFSADKPELLEGAFKQARELKEQIKASEKLEQGLEGELEDLRVKLEKYEKAVYDFTQDKVRKKSEYETLQKGLKKLKSDDYDEYEEVQLTEKISIIKNKIEENRIKLERGIGRRDQLTGALIGLKERSDFLKKAVADSQHKAAFLGQQLETALEASSFSGFDAILIVLSQSLDIDSLKNDASNYRQKVYSVRMQVEKLEETLDKQVFDKERFLLIETQIAEGQTMFEDERTRFIKEHSIFEREQSDFNKKKDLLVAMALLEKRGTNLDTLKRLFKGSGFVSYISSVYLQNLCHEANKRFYKLTNQQLQLEVDADNNFQVRDFLNNGRVRSVKTLSGGQTFQASLSLALALAESVQQQNKSKQNFFFLDEGFGSLDRESLQTALATLKTLRKENRMVGVISHVEELQQEIDVYLNVKNEPTRGSLIYGSWQSSQ